LYTKGQLALGDKRLTKVWGAVHKSGQDKAALMNRYLSVVLQTQNEVIRVAKADIDERKKSPVSMMPEGLLAPLSDAEVRDLIAYLAGSEQVPLPK
jgi:hypothetical protein